MTERRASEKDPPLSEAVTRSRTLRRLGKARNSMRTARSFYLFIACLYLVQVFLGGMFLFASDSDPRATTGDGPSPYAIAVVVAAAVYLVGTKRLYREPRFWSATLAVIGTLQFSTILVVVSLRDGFLWDALVGPAILALAHWMFVVWVHRACALIRAHPDLWAVLNRHRRRVAERARATEPHPKTPGA
jgi:hypothetical protein